MEGFFLQQMKSPGTHNWSAYREKATGILICKENICITSSLQKAQGSSWKREWKDYWMQNE